MPIIEKLIQGIFLFCLSAVCWPQTGFADDPTATDSPPSAVSPDVLKTYVSVAAFNGMDRLAEVDLSNLLQKHDIPFFYQGLFFYDVMVPPAQEKAAAKIVAAEARRGFFLILCKAGIFDDKSRDVLLYSDAMKERSPIVDQLFKCGDIQSKFGGFTYVKNVYARKKLIWVAPDRQEIAFTGRITLKPQKYSDTERYVSFQMWNQGRNGTISSADGVAVQPDVD